MDNYLSLMIEEYVEIEDIEEILYKLEFVKRYEASYYWFKQHESILGCEIEIQRDIEICVNDEPWEHKNFKTVCRTETFSGCSFADLEMQNKVLKLIQDKFGGTLFDIEEYQTDFIKNDLPKFTKTEIACGLEYSKFVINVNRVRKLIEEVDEIAINILARNKSEPFDLLLDDNLLRNNVLIPFCVSVLENFLKTFLKKYLETNKEARDRIYNQKETLPYSEIKKLMSGEKSIVDMEINKFSFQRLQSVNSAYISYLDINLKKTVLNKRFPYNGEEIVISDVLNELITQRHQLIHEAELVVNLNREEMEKYLYFLKGFGESFIDEIMKKHNIKLIVF
ncbi:HEPN domain-containing protein [Bacillus sp. FJAT-51639]|uniref:HEPN domain-containing protein n=1 Tax=Bacillus bruguierae TaxID=3127667 RepID=A0ABU8FCI2_9BACI